MPGLLQRPKVIYGVDNRREIYEAPQKWQELAKSTVTLVRSDQIVLNQDPGLYELLGHNYRKEKNLCSDEPYGEQRMVAHCSGFLVAPDIVATAGHCIKDQDHCKRLAYVFDVQKSSAQEYDYKIDKEKFYSCKNLIKKVEDKVTKIDYALIRLNKKVTDREPLKLSQSKGPTKGEEMAVIGHPYGIPKKFADEGYILENSHNAYFKVDLDTYSYNSGSPIFNIQTMEVEGILVRGESDFVYDKNALCYRSRVCDPGECHGEEVNRIHFLTPYL